MPTCRHELHWDRIMRCYADRPANVDAMFRAAAARAPDAEAVIDGATRLTYAQLDAAVDRVAANLAARGVGSGARVALMLANRHEAVLATLAVLRLGAIIVPIGTRLRKPEIEYILGDAEPVALIHEASLAGELPEDGCPAAHMRFSVGADTVNVNDRADRATSFAVLLDAGAPTPPRLDIDERALFGILYTSGTTGRPKGAMLTHLGAVHSCLHWVDQLQLGANEMTVLAIPWSHVAGLCGVLLPFLHIGGKLVMMATFDKHAFLELASAERISHALLVPAMVSGSPPAFYLTSSPPATITPRSTTWRNHGQASAIGRGSQTANTVA